MQVLLEWQETLDRVSIAQELIESILLNHSLIKAVPEFSSQAEEVSRLLADLYQQIGTYESIDEIAKAHTIRLKT